MRHALVSNSLDGCYSVPRCFTHFGEQSPADSARIHEAEERAPLACWRSHSAIPASCRRTSRDRVDLLFRTRAIFAEIIGKREKPVSFSLMRDSYLEEFYSFLRFPSVSTDDQYAVQVRDCARWLSQKLSAIGLKSQVVPTAGHPVVWAHNHHREGRPTVLTYGHYDVQPPDPLELWESPPFEPVLKNGYVFARGATDNKGQILSHI